MHTNCFGEVLLELMPTQPAFTIHHQPIIISCLRVSSIELHSTPTQNDEFEQVAKIMFESSLVSS